MKKKRRTKRVKGWMMASWRDWVCVREKGKVLQWMGQGFLVPFCSVSSLLLCVSAASHWSLVSSLISVHLSPTQPSKRNVLPAAPLVQSPHPRASSTTFFLHLCSLLSPASLLLLPSLALPSFLPFFLAPEVFPLHPFFSFQSFLVAITSKGCTV